MKRCSCGKPLKNSIHPDTCISCIGMYERPKNKKWYVYLKYYVFTDSGSLIKAFNVNDSWEP